MLLNILFISAIICLLFILYKNNRQIASLKNRLNGIDNFDSEKIKLEKEEILAI